MQSDMSLYATVSTIALTVAITLFCSQEQQAFGAYQERATNQEAPAVLLVTDSFWCGADFWQSVGINLR